MTDFATEGAAAATPAADATNTPAAPGEVAVTAAPKVKPIFFSRFSMRTTLVVNGQARPDIKSTLMAGIYRENPRLVVKTNDPADEQNNYGKVTAAMDPITWRALTNAIRKLVANPTKDIQAFKNYNKYKGGQKFDDPQHINTTIVGREEDGRIWIKIVEEGRPAPVFFFGPPEYHVLLNMDKSEKSAAEASQLYAMAFVDSLDMVMAVSMGKRDDGEQDSADARKPGTEPDPQRQQGNWGNRQGGGGFNRGGGGGGWQGRQGGGGGGFNRGGGGGGNWGNRQGGGGGNWNRGGGNGGGGGYNGGGNRQGGGQPSVSNDEITF